MRRAVPNIVGEADRLIERGRDVILTEADALRNLADILDDQFVAACYAILGLRRQLVVTGMGKSGHIARKIAATFAATGTPAIFVHPAEAGHGDMGMLASGDVLLALSNSGNTVELRAMLVYARRLRIPIIGVASTARSMVGEHADIRLIPPPLREACPINIAPTTSTTVQLALGDALAMTVMDMRGISRSELGALHPGGVIGLALSPVTDVMNGADRMPLVGLREPMAEAISTMTRGCFGVVGVLDEAGGLAGLITDGDLRRHFDVLATACAADVMTAAPKVIPADMLAGEALQFLNDNRITAAFVVPGSGGGSGGDRQPPIGIIHIHDLLRQGLG